VGEGSARSAPDEGSISVKLEFCEQIFQNGIAPLQDVIIPVTNNAKSLPRQNSIALLIPLGIRVLPTINFDNKALLETYEV